jgi:hypothetical protein
MVRGGNFTRENIPSMM